jgi:hypothetical protein
MRGDSRVPQFTTAEEVRGQILICQVRGIFVQSHTSLLNQYTVLTSRTHYVAGNKEESHSDDICNWKQSFPTASKALSAQRVICCPTVHSWLNRSCCVAYVLDLFPVSSFRNTPKRITLAGFQNFYTSKWKCSTRRYPYFNVVVGLVWSHDPKSHAGGSVC